MGVLETAHTAFGQVDLRDVARDHHLGAEPEARQEHLHLLRGRVLRLIEYDERVVQSPASHERKRGDLDYTPLQVRLELRRVDHLVEGIVERPEVRVDLGHHVSRQEAESLPRLDCRPGEYDPGHLASVERLHRQRHGEVGLAGPRGPDPEDDLMLADGVRVSLLVAGLRGHPAATVREDHIPQNLPSPTGVRHPEQTLGGLRRRVVTVFGEPDKTVEDGLCTLNRRLGPAQHDLVSSHDHLALDQLLDPPQDRVAVPEDLEHPPRRYDELRVYLGVRFLLLCSLTAAWRAPGRTAPVPR